MTKGYDPSVKRKKGLKGYRVLQVQGFPDVLRYKLKMEALKRDISFRQLIIQILTDFLHRSAKGEV